MGAVFRIPRARLLKIADAIEAEGEAEIAKILREIANRHGDRWFEPKAERRPFSIEACLR